MRIPYMKHVTWYLVLCMCLISFVPRVDAAFSPSEVLKLSPTDRASDIQKIRQVLEMKAVGERLKQLGLTAGEVEQRLSLLSDQQIHQIAMQLDDLKVGQDDVLGVIIALLVIVILVIVILRLTGHKVIVTR